MDVFPVSGLEHQDSKYIVLKLAQDAVGAFLRFPSRLQKKFK